MLPNKKRLNTPLTWIRVCVIKRRETTLDGIIKCTCDGRENATLLSEKNLWSMKRVREELNAKKMKRVQMLFPRLHVIKILFYHRDISRSICSLLFNYLRITRETFSIYFSLMDAVIATKSSRNALKFWNFIFHLHTRSTFLFLRFYYVNVIKYNLEDIYHVDIAKNLIWVNFSIFFFLNFHLKKIFHLSRVEVSLSSFTFVLFFHIILSAFLKVYIFRYTLQNFPK